MHDQQLALLPNTSITSRSLRLPDDCTLQVWEECGRQIGVCVDAGPFIIGDLLNEGAKRFGISLGAFLKSDAAKSMPGISSFSYDSLNSFASVMEKIPSSHRVKGVSFAHHQAASKLLKGAKPADELLEAHKWLNVAKAEKLSLREMAFAIQGRKSLTDIEKKTETTKSTQSSLAIEATVPDLAVTLLRNLRALNALFEAESDPIADWTSQRRNAAIIALEPNMDELERLTNFFIELRK